MVMAADLSCRMGWLDTALRDRIVALVEKAGLPVVSPTLGTERWVELMQVDKKNAGGEIQFVLLRTLGEAVVTGVPMDLLDATLRDSSARRQESV